ncbi:hypothetical protein KDU71_01760 [Carboxylicivirga sediminis]|uniref:Uncharacterized protein n=1 Tax=Carboxylicivirga sediminis TaxID=2006564 RepID=A0A941IX45_9BACT|nr:hypothetical protein [Carboxylicivirga sediminis]MBR8534267.1 hypothetical protein [Carboxylicivirga sediminis]
MIEKEVLQEMLPEINSVKKEDVKPCNIPVSVYVQEAGNLHERMSLDSARLQALGMDPALQTRLDKLRAALFAAEVDWQEQQSERQKALELWKEKSPALYDLRKDIIEHLAFAFRKDERLMEQLAAIEEGNSHADAIEDLARLAVLGVQNPELVQAINYDATKFDTANTMVSEMSGVLSAANGYLYRDDERKLIRDKAYTLLKEVVDEVRDYGRFAFRNDPEHVKGYSSKYARDQAKAYRRSLKEKQE